MSHLRWSCRAVVPRIASLGWGSGLSCWAASDSLCTSKALRCVPQQQHPSSGSILIRASCLTLKAAMPVRSHGRPGKKSHRGCRSSRESRLHPPGWLQTLRVKGCAGPDQVAHAQANSEKLRLEKKQRAARQAADRGDPIRPRWFKANPNKQDVDDLAFVYNGGYFEARRRGNYEVRPCSCPGGCRGGACLGGRWWE